MDEPLSVSRRAAALAMLTGALVCEGFDVATASFSALDIVRDFHVAKQALGPFLAASAFGMLIGSSLIAPWGDRVGRRPLVVFGVAGFSAFTLLSALSMTLWQLTLSRFLIGICVGALLPNAVILAGELVKDSARARTSAAVTLGITLGASFTGIAAAAILPAYGWRGLSVFGGAIPLLFSAILWKALPESPVFGARVKDRTPMKWTPAPLFRNGLGGMTLAIWLLVILLSMSLYLLSNWMPLLLRQSGLDMSQASLAGGVYYFGGLIGGVLIVVLLGRAGWRTLATFLVLAAISVLIVSHVHRPVLALMVSLAIAGVFMTGSQAAFNGLGASAYPIAVRASGFGYALGVMRIGTISGPILGATLIAGGLNDAQSLFLIPVGPLLIAACAATWLAMRSRRLANAVAIAS